MSNTNRFESNNSEQQSGKSRKKPQIITYRQGSLSGLSQQKQHIANIQQRQPSGPIKRKPQPLTLKQNPNPVSSGQSGPGAFLRAASLPGTQTVPSPKKRRPQPLTLRQSPRTLKTSEPGTLLRPVSEPGIQPETSIKRRPQPLTLRQSPRTLKTSEPGIQPETSIKRRPQPLTIKQKPQTLPTIDERETPASVPVPPRRLLRETPERQTSQGLPVIEERETPASVPVPPRARAVSTSHSQWSQVTTVQPELYKEAVPARSRSLPAQPELYPEKHVAALQKKKTKKPFRVIVSFLSFVAILFCVLNFGGQYIYNRVEPEVSKRLGLDDLLILAREDDKDTIHAQGPTDKSGELTQDMYDYAKFKLTLFEEQIAETQQQGLDVSTHQENLDLVQESFDVLKTKSDYVIFLIEVNLGLTMLQQDRANSDINVMFDNYLDEVKRWGQDNIYHNGYDNKKYTLNSSYDIIDGGNGYMYGHGSYIKDDIANGVATLDDITEGYFLHSMMEANFVDPTPYNQPHKVDQQLLNYYGVTNDHVLIVSLTEQSMRIYRNGVLEEALLVTTGRHYRPTPPGLFQLSTHEYNSTFTSFDTPASPDYYEPVVVPNAITFRHDGYLIHSSPWRTDYGPYTNLPHEDSGEDKEGNNGSHGCINVETETLARLDPTLTTETKIIIF